MEKKYDVLLVGMFRGSERYPLRNKMAQAIKILQGEYKDVIYQYGKINFVPREESEIPTIDFERAVRSCPEDLKESISDDEHFNQLMGNILIELLANQGLEELKNGI